MEFEQQKPITDEYRKGWERIYAQQEARKSEHVIINRAELAESLEKELSTFTPEERQRFEMAASKWKHEARKYPRLSTVNTNGACLTPELVRKTIANWKIQLGREEYPNGCPILSEGPQKDDL